MAEIILPNMPDVIGQTIGNDQQLRDFLIAVKNTLEKITGATPEELDDLLNKNK